MNLKLMLTMLLVFFALIFAFQNRMLVEIRFLVWSVELSQAFFLLVTLFVGILIGWLFSGYLQIRKRLQKRSSGEAAGQESGPAG